jgi:hypothetical protein
MQIIDCITWIIHQHLLEYKIEEKLHREIREQKKVEYHWSKGHQPLVEDVWIDTMFCTRKRQSLIGRVNETPRKVLRNIFLSPQNVAWKPA